MFKNKWGPVLLILALGLVLVAAGCGGKEPAKSGEKVIKVGLVAPLTGDVQSFGEYTKNGFLLALEEAGYKAGDYKIEPVIVDDRNDANEGANVATKLVSQDKVKAIIGPVTTRSAIPVSDIANSNKVVMIASTATNEKVTVADGKRKEYVFRACFIDPFQGTIGAKFALDTLKAKTAAVLYDQTNDYTIGLANYFKDNFTKGGGEIVAFEAYSKDDKDFSAVLTNIARKNPDLLYLPDYHQKVSIIGKQAREKGIKAIFLGGDGWDSPDLDFATMSGGYFTNHFSADDPRPEVKSFVEKYKAKYNTTPEFCAALSYDATKLLLNAIAKANSDDTTKIKDILKDTKDFPAVSGKISFDKDGNPTKAITILQVREDKKYNYVTTVNP
ncbi:MAG: ABC transporter substrate-binding protein [Pelotomaculum sp.]|uniref:ABC-type branched-chain amino acid transport systems, periplasmic component n=1 Tax=Pelotomaculum thermopropionicum (strain DSM 13744 / JCM 10971 / SI) TaxID=370438 RepID=A5D670_PELTS|nr:ABC transporter substrate-binding protein [Pelotomaculum sp.]BAF58258.1 ABC-type branched-chain amino acid transport systems, periplasmic component [Pelotomaculum thermopropionicum SI]